MLAGVPGYSTWQSSREFESTVRPLRPEITILCCGAYNDYIGAIGRSDAEIAEAAGSGVRSLSLRRNSRRPAVELRGRDGPARRERLSWPSSVLAELTERVSKPNR